MSSQVPRRRRPGRASSSFSYSKASGAPVETPSKHREPDGRAPSSSSLSVPGIFERAGCDVSLTSKESLGAPTTGGAMSWSKTSAGRLKPSLAWFLHRRFGSTTRASRRVEIASRSEPALGTARVSMRTPWPKPSAFLQGIRCHSAPTVASKLLRASRPHLLVGAGPHRLQSSSATPSALAYHAAADETLETILDAVDDLDQRRDDVECELASGVLTITCWDGSWVINKQAPNKQIWVSSPLRCDIFP